MGNSLSFCLKGFTIMLGCGFGIFGSFKWVCSLVLVDKPGFGSFPDLGLNSGATVLKFGLFEGVRVGSKFSQVRSSSMFVIFIITCFSILRALCDYQQKCFIFSDSWSRCMFTVYQNLIFAGVQNNLPM